MIRDFDLFFCRVILCNDILAVGLGAIHTTVHINPSRKPSFSKTLLKSEEFENVDFWKAEFFENLISLIEFLSNTNQEKNPKWLVIVVLSNCSDGVEWTTESQEILIRFQSVNTVFKCP